MQVGRIFKSGSDLKCTASIADSSGTGLTGLTVKFSIYGQTEGFYWDNGSGAFDSAAEVLNTGTHRADGAYDYTLTSGYTSTNVEYRVHVEATDSVTGDTYDTAEVWLVENDTANIEAGITASEPISANMTQIAGSATVDTRALDVWAQWILAYCTGQIDRSGNAYAYRDQGDTTDLFTLTSASANRTRS